MISVIVIGRNEGDRLIPCFESIQKACQYLGHEIIYVDSASTDNSVELAGRYAHCYAVRDSSPTPGLGRFIGTEVARGDWLLFLDGDMQLDASFLMRALPKATTAKAEAMTGQRHDDYYQDGRLVSTCENYFGCTTERVAPEFGGALFIRRDALLRAGGWSPDTVACEEEELHSRLTAHNIPVLEIPEPMIRHSDTVTRNRSPLSILFNRRQLGLGEAFRCACAHHQARAYIRFNAIRFLFYLLDILAVLALLLIRPWGLPLFCLLEMFQLGYYLSKRIPRRFVSQNLFFFYFPIGLITYHVRDRSYTDLSEGGGT